MTEIRTSEIHQTDATNDRAALRSPQDLRVEAAKLHGQREEKQSRLNQINLRSEELKTYLGIADKVSSALQSLSEELFEEVLGFLEQKLTIALRDVFEQLGCDADVHRAAFPGQVGRAAHAVVD